MKKIVLVSSYCDNEEKKIVLTENLIKLKSRKNMDVLLITPLSLTEDIIDLCDFYFQTKENPILSWPTRMYTHWYEQPLPNNKIVTLKRGLSDYGWAGLYQVKKLSEIALSYDYDLYYHIIYDLDLDNFVLNELEKNEPNKVYPRRDPHNPETIWETTLHFMIFDKETMKKIVDEITLENYLNSDGVAEGQVLKWKNKFGVKGASEPVKDKIFYWKNFDFFDYKISEDFKFFVSKNHKTNIWIGENPAINTELSDNLRIVFHGFENSIQIEIILNGVTFSKEVTSWQIVELPVSSQKVDSLVLRYKDKIVDFTSEYEKITYNEVYYNHRP